MSRCFLYGESVEVLMKKLFQKKFPSVFNSIAAKKNILKNHSAIGMMLGLASISVIFLMTGLLYFRNEAFIDDNGESYRVFTMYDTIGEILSEQGISVGEFDRVDFGGVVDGEAEITIHRALSLPVTADGSTVNVECAYDETVADVIARSGVTLSEQDFVTPDEKTLCADVEKIEVLRAYDAFISVDGETITAKTANQTVKEFLAFNGVILQQDDYTDIALDSPVTEGMTVSVTRVRYVERQTMQVIPYETETVVSNLVSMYSSEITQQGENGTRVNTSRVKYVNGVRVSETAVSSTVTTEPVTEIISTGAALRTPYSDRDSDSLTLENGLPTDYAYVLSGKSTAYTAPAGCGTASGRTLRVGTVAVDPNVIPYGSELYIVSSDHSYVYGYAIAADTGNLTAHGVLVDVYMGTTDEAYSISCSYGAKYVDVYVLSVGSN